MIKLGSLMSLQPYLHRACNINYQIENFTVLKIIPNSSLTVLIVDMCIYNSNFAEVLPV